MALFRNPAQVGVVRYPAEEYPRYGTDPEGHQMARSRGVHPRPFRAGGGPPNTGTPAPPGTLGTLPRAPSDRGGGALRNNVLEDRRPAGVPPRFPGPGTWLLHPCLAPRGPSPLPAGPPPLLALTNSQVSTKFAFGPQQGSGGAPAAQEGTCRQTGGSGRGRQSCCSRPTGPTTLLPPLRVLGSRWLPG